MKKRPYFLYLLLCGNGAIYTGISMDVEHRFAVHKSGKGARYTKIFGAKKILYTEKVGAVGKALKRELAVKKFSPEKKRALARSAKKKTKTAQSL